MNEQDDPQSHIVHLIVFLAVDQREDLLLEICTISQLETKLYSGGPILLILAYRR